MHLYNLILILICLCSLHPAWGQAFYTERIFLTTEKESCMPGDTLLANGQVMPANNESLDAYSRYVYIECIDNRDSLLLRQKVACDEKGYFYTEIPTQLEWNTNLCYLRAYTRLMQNYKPESLTVIPFFLGAVHPQKTEVAREVFADIYPEGGSLLNGFQQNLVVHLTDDDGFPIVPTEVRVLDVENDTVIHQIAVSDNGLGRFAFQPVAGKQYRLQAEYDGRFFHFPLKTTASGTALQAIMNRNRLTCRIFSSEEKAFHLFLYHSETGLVEISLPAGQAAAVIDLSEHPKGLYTLFLTDNDYHVLNERSLWLPPTEQTFATCRLPQTTYAPEAPLNYECQAPDSSIVFARIVYPNDLIATQAYPALKFGNEIISPVRFPLMDNEQWMNQMTEIDNWLFTARFALFPMNKLLKPHSYFAEDVMLLSGTAWEKENHPLKTGTIIGAQNTKDQLYYSGTTDEKGHFIIPVDNYSSGTPFVLSAQDVKGKKQDCTFTLDKETYPKVSIPFPVFRQTRLHTDILPEDASIRYSEDENREKVYHIDNVTVQARKPVDIREMSRTPLNFIGEIELQKRASLSIRSVLSRFPTIVIRTDNKGGGTGELAAVIKNSRFNNEDWDRSPSDPSLGSGGLGIFWRNARGPQLGGGNLTKLTVVVDGEIAFSDISYILDQPAGGIKSIELIKPTDTRCVPYNAMGGVLLIKTLYGLGRQTTEQSSETTVYPLGLSTSSKEPGMQLNAPRLPGRYLLLVDVITKDKKVASFCREFEVK